MHRPVAFDMTHIVTRFDRLAMSGIDQVDFAYARHFARSDRLLCGAHYGLVKPHRFASERVRDTLARLEGKRDGAASSLDWQSLRRWIVGAIADAPPMTITKPKIQWSDFAHKWKLRVTVDGRFDPPAGAIYLNVAQHAFEFPRYFRWLDARPDLMPVILVHDLLPLERPEFFRHGYEARFERRLATILRHARAIVTTSDVVRERLAATYAARGHAPVPIHVQPLASPLEMDGGDDSFDEELAQQPYCVIVSTVEPRKNHLMLLHVWRQLAERSANPPKLVIVGAPGWDYGQAVSALERSPLLRRHVNHVSSLPAENLRTLIAHARALLMPSFAEGYGLPVVEALTLGTPVIASDIPVFHEVSQGLATFVSPLNGDAWMAAIEAHAQGRPQSRLPPGGRSNAFKAPDWAGYFAGIEAFFDRL